MKIAVIGSGVSGLTCAYTLARAHDVNVYEADSRLGGHANTIDVNNNGRSMPIDTGFIVFNEKNYPLLCALFDELGVRSEMSNMSFSVHCERTGREWNGSSLNQVFAQRSNLLRPSHWTMLRDIVNFHSDAEREFLTLDERETVSDWVQRMRYSASFLNYYLLPLGASLWSCSSSTFGSFPIRFVIEFLRNHHMLQVEKRPMWRTVSGGSREYVKRITEPFAHRIRLETPVKRVKRTAQGIVVTDWNNNAELFDEVVLAVHADQALQMLSLPDDDERDVLSAFPYQKNLAVLHHDTSLLPSRPSAWASWNFRNPQDSSEDVNVTYNMNLLQNLDSEQTWCVTLNPGSRVNREKIEQVFEYHHPLFTTGRAEAQARHTEMVRRDGLSFCGAYWGFGFHEDGVRSALDVCAAFDVDLRMVA
ncbi:MAG: NAD(P)-binding protein [Chromatiales bacterium]|jgi:uncharacterized protein|nr:NAD(P)-binding protein [Chromatiales bacterium]